MTGNYGSSKLPVKAAVVLATVAIVAVVELAASVVLISAVLISVGSAVLTSVVKVSIGSTVVIDTSHPTSTILEVMQNKFGLTIIPLNSTTKTV